MIIRLIAASRSIEIDDPGNFKAFSVRIEGALDAAAQAELLGRIAVKHLLRLADGARLHHRGFLHDLAVSGIVAGAGKYHDLREQPCRDRGSHETGILEAGRSCRTRA